MNAPLNLHEILEQCKSSQIFSGGACLQTTLGLAGLAYARVD